MAIHSNANELTVEVVQEYLDVVNLCIATRKRGGGIYGYTAVLLLFCVIEAIGNSLLEGNEPFRVLRGPPFSTNLNDRQIKNLEKWYRHLLAHNGMIAPGTRLSPEIGGDPFTFMSDEPVVIRVKSFHKLVSTAWEKTDKSKLNVGWDVRRNPEISCIPSVSTVLTSVPIGASGSNYVPRQDGRRRK